MTEVLALNIKIQEQGAAAVKASTDKLAASMRQVEQVAQKTSGRVGKLGADFVRTGQLSQQGVGNMVEAAGQMAFAFGPQGALVASIVALGVTLARTFHKMQEDVKKAHLEIIADTRRMFATMSAIASDTDGQRIADAIVEMQRGQMFVIGEEQLRLLPEAERKAALFERGLVRLRAEYARMEQTATAAAAAEARWTSGERSRELAAKVADFRTQMKTLTPLMGEYRTAISQLEQTAQVALSTLGRVGIAVDVAREEARRAMPAMGGAARIGLGGFDRGAAQLPKTFRDQFIKMEQEARAASLRLGIAVREALAGDLARSLADGIAAGFAALTAPGGTLGKMFNAFIGMMLGGIGDAMIKFGMAGAAFAKLQDKIMSMLQSLNPKGALVASLAMIAAGGALKGAAAGMFQRGTGGAGMTAIGGGMAFGGENATRLVFGNTSATTAAGMTPRTPMAVTIIGPNDPVAQRQLQALMQNANARGNV